MPTIYLCGPINGCTDEEARWWRATASIPLLAQGWTILDPMSRDYRGREAENVEDIVWGDLDDITASDVVLVNATRPSWGTAMEVVYAALMDKRIVAFGTDKPSPWLLYHCDTVCSSLDDALTHLCPAPSLRAPRGAK